MEATLLPGACSQETPTTQTQKRPLESAVALRPVGARVGPSMDHITRVDVHEGAASSTTKRRAPQHRNFHGQFKLGHDQVAALLNTLKVKDPSKQHLRVFAAKNGWYEFRVWVQNPTTTSAVQKMVLGENPWMSDGFQIEKASDPYHVGESHIAEAGTPKRQGVSIQARFMQRGMPRMGGTEAPDADDDQDQVEAGGGGGRKGKRGR